MTELQTIENAKIEKENAVREAKEKAEAVATKIEYERLKKIANEKAEAEKLAANKKHRSKINNEALICFIANGITTEQANELITMIAKNKIEHITINY